MSKQNYNAKLKDIEALTDQKVKTPNMPVAEAVQEAENLVAWCQDDKEDLVKAGLDWSVVEDLPIRAGACRYAQSVWARESQSREEAQMEWNARSPEAFELRDELVHHFLFAFRKELDLLRKTQIIREGGSNADMLQDLSDLSILGTENLPYLKAIGLDDKILKKAADWSDELSAMLAKSNGEAGDNVEVKMTRDKAYSFMKAAMDDIREAGQYVFYRDEHRKKGYVSNYHKKRTNRRENSQEKEVVS